jgi:hypothetical protein
MDKNSIKPAKAKYLTQHNRYALCHTVYSIVLYLSGLLWRIAVNDWFSPRFIMQAMSRLYDTLHGWCELVRLRVDRYKPALFLTRRVGGWLGTIV